MESQPSCESFSWKLWKTFGNVLENIWIEDVIALRLVIFLCFVLKRGNCYWVSVFSFHRLLLDILIFRDESEQMPACKQVAV